MPSRTAAALGTILGLAVAGAATAATTATPAPPPPPLVHFRSLDSSCLVSFPDLPGVRHVCIDFAFLDTDLWVYRDGSWLRASGEQHQTLPPSPPGTLPVSRVRQGKLSAADFSNLSKALAKVGIATAQGGCTPFSTAPPLPELPAPDFHYQIVWYGKDFRHNVVTVGAEFPDPCPQDVADLVRDLVLIENLQ